MLAFSDTQCHCFGDRQGLHCGPEQDNHPRKLDESWILHRPFPTRQAASFSVPTSASRRRIRFDFMPPRIKILARHRMKGPPFRPEEEEIDTALQRARWEYLADNELRQKHNIEKRSSLNAQLHAVFPTLAQEEQQPSKQHANKNTPSETTTSTTTPLNNPRSKGPQLSSAHPALPLPAPPFSLYLLLAFSLRA